YVDHLDLHSFPTRRSSDLALARLMKINPDRLKESARAERQRLLERAAYGAVRADVEAGRFDDASARYTVASAAGAHSDRLEGLRSEEHTSELQSPYDLVCR